MTLLEGHARLLDEYNVELGGQRSSVRRMLIATGGWAHIPDISRREHAFGSSQALLLEQWPWRGLVAAGIGR